MTHAELVAHLTGTHTLHPTTFGGVATHSKEWLTELHDTLTQLLIPSDPEFHRH